MIKIKDKDVNKFMEKEELKARPKNYFGWEKEESLSDNIIESKRFADILTTEKVRRFVKKLKEVLVCDFCKENPSYDMMCSQCNNAGIKINKIFGDKLT